MRKWKTQEGLREVLSFENLVKTKLPSWSLCSFEDLPFKGVRTFSCSNFVSVSGIALHATKASDSQSVVWGP